MGRLAFVYFHTGRSKAVPLLQFLSVCALVVSYVAFSFYLFFFFIICSFLVSHCLALWKALFRECGISWVSLPFIQIIFFYF